jgi:cytochrome c oxidase subunit 2
MLASSLIFQVVALMAVIVAHGLQPSTPRRVSVEAERFSFSPSRIKIAVGEEIEIRLQSADTSHGFRIEGTDVDVEIPKRGKGEVIVRYIAAAPGRFTFECSRMCGAGHHFMRGEIVVEDKGDRR